MQKKRIYIAGKISGLPDEEVEAKFRASQMALQALGCEPVNPVAYCRECGLTPENKWIDFMECCLEVLAECDGIYMQPDWKYSDGAKVEYLLAKMLAKYKQGFFLMNNEQCTMNNGGYNLLCKLL